MRFIRLNLLTAVFAIILCSCQLVQKNTSSDYVHVKGTQIVDKNENPLTLRSMGMGNIFYCYPNYYNPDDPECILNYHHKEAAYKELSELGFNCVRFLLNYQLFEDDETPFEYKEDGFKWIDTNIEWAKKYNIGIVLNMHVPQGGYQSNGEGTELWYKDDVYDGNENQLRLCALWKEISRHYKTEPVIIGYGIVNEPTALYVAPENEAEQDAIQEAINRWNSLANRIAAGIREEDKNHIIFIESCSVRDENLTWIGTDGYETYPEIDDNNLVYEFHNYNPYYYTHLIDTGNAATSNHIYPDENYSEQNYVKWLGNKITVFQNNAEDWKEQWQQASITINTEDVKKEFEEAGIFNIKIQPAFLMDSSSGTSGSLFIDDIKLYKIDQNGNETELENCTFDTEELWSIGSNDNSAEITYNSEEGNTTPGCLEYSMTNTYSWSADENHRFNLENGCSYKLTLWYKGKKLNEKAKESAFGFDVIKGYIKNGLNYDFLYDSLEGTAQSFKENGRACFCGEFGCKRLCFDENRGGASWVKDTISIFNKLDLSYSYHAYHESSFGLHNSYANVTLPDDKDLCVELAEVFKETNSQ